MKTLFLTLLIFGAFSTLNADETPKIVTCDAGFAKEYPCSNVDLWSTLDLIKSGIPGAKMGNDIWGWTDPVTGHEIAIMGMSNKASFVDIHDPLQPVHLGDLPTHSVGVTHRDIKIYKDHAFVSSEAMQHGIQIFDLRTLPIENPPEKPVVFMETNWYPYLSRAHNIAINEDSGFAYVVGTNTCDGGLHVIDIGDPSQPQFSTCIDRVIFEPIGSLSNNFLFGPRDESYTHDVQCVTYQGPDSNFSGKEICVASNDDSVNIVDVTDKANPVQISALKYKDHGFVHQGWLTEDHRYFLLGDEFDEVVFKHNTRTYVFDLTNLAALKYVGYHEHETKAIDHNLYVKGDYVFQANYSAGLRILKLGDLSQAEMTEMAFFDVQPEPDKESGPSMFGSWSVYPYFFQWQCGSQPYEGDPVCTQTQFLAFFKAKKTPCSTGRFDFLNSSNFLN